MGMVEMKIEFKVTCVLRSTTYLLLGIDVIYLSITHIAYNMNVQTHKTTAKNIGESI